MPFAGFRWDDSDNLLGWAALQLPTLLDGVLHAWEHTKDRCELQRETDFV